MQPAEVSWDNVPSPTFVSHLFHRASALYETMGNGLLESGWEKRHSPSNLSKSYSAIWNGVIMIGLLIFLSLILIVLFGFLASRNFGGVKDALADDIVKTERCENTAQGKEFLADEHGYICRRQNAETNGCCPRTPPDANQNNFFPRYSCHSCISPASCCLIYEFCVSCCMDPDRDELVADFLAQTNHPIYRTFADNGAKRFEFCKARCRTSSTSVQNSNTYRSQYKYCYGADPPPYFALTPSLTSGGEEDSRQTESVRESTGEGPHKMKITNAASDDERTERDSTINNELEPSVATKTQMLIAAVAPNSADKSASEYEDEAEREYIVVASRAAPLSAGLYFMLALALGLLLSYYYCFPFAIAGDAERREGESEREREYQEKYVLRRTKERKSNGHYE